MPTHSIPRARAPWLALLTAASFGCQAAPSDDVQTIEQPLTATLTSTADAYVRDGSSSATNFGTATTLEVKHSTAGFNREAMVSFGLSSFSGTVQSAKLRLFGSASNSGSLKVVAHVLAEDAVWSEGSVTWDNRPLPILELARVTVSGTTAVWYEFDVTALVRQKKRQGRASIDFELRSLITSDPVARFNSREAASNRPQLVVSTATALFVVGNTTLSAADTAIRDRLQQAGYAVTAKTGAAAVTADATGASLVVISSTVTSTDVNTKFRDVTTPVVVLENALYDDMKLTGTVSGTDFGATGTQTKVNIVKSSHALAGGREGTLTVTSASATLGWGKPGSSAQKIATLTGDATRFTLFGYDKGAAMVGMNAPARRVGLFLHDATAASLTANGWTLFDAAVAWASGSRPFTVKKVLVLNYDPILESQGGVRLSDYYKSRNMVWFDARKLSSDFVRDMAQASGDYVRYQVTSIVDIDEWILFTDGFRYTDDSFVTAYDSNTFHEGAADYALIIANNNLDARVGSGEFDEVIIAAPPANGLSESMMVGPNAYYINGTEIRRSIPRNYVIEFLDTSRSVALFQHGYIHRMEWILRHVYGEKYGPGPSIGNWNSDPYGPPCYYITDPSPCFVQRRHNWDKFTLVDGVAQNLRSLGDTSAFAGVGAAHFVPNALNQALDNYNYGRARALPAVQSTADDWLYNYPTLTGETRIVDTSEWNFHNFIDDDQYGFMLWWFNHAPRAGGRFSDAVMNNWWEYAVNYNDYPEALE